MQIIKESDLLLEIEKNKLIPLRLNNLDLTSYIELSSPKYKDILNLVKQTDSDSIFYKYNYYTLEDLILPENFRIDYSDILNEVDFTKPKSLTIGMFYNGIFIGFILHNNWLDELSILSDVELMERLNQQVYTKAIKPSQHELRNDAEDTQELREIIYTDPEFRFCKNHELRYWYLVKLLKNPSMEKYKYLVTPYGAPFIGKVIEFMAETWFLYKKQNNKTKEV